MEGHIKHMSLSIFCLLFLACTLPSNQTVSFRLHLYRPLSSLKLHFSLPQRMNYNESTNRGRAAVKWRWISRILGDLPYNFINTRGGSVTVSGYFLGDCYRLPWEIGGFLHIQRKPRRLLKWCSWLDIENFNLEEITWISAYWIFKACRSIKKGRKVFSVSTIFFASIVYQITASGVVTSVTLVSIFINRRLSISLLSKII